MCQHVTQPGFGGGPVQLGGADQGVNRGSQLAAAVDANEQVVAATDGASAKRIKTQGCASHTVAPRFIRQNASKLNVIYSLGTGNSRTLPT